MEGWECPKCGKVNAPFVRSCDCHIEREIGKPATSGLEIPVDKDYKYTCLWDGMTETFPGSGMKIGNLSCPCPKCRPIC